MLSESVIASISDAHVPKVAIIGEKAIVKGRHRNGEYCQESKGEGPRCEAREKKSTSSYVVLSIISYTMLLYLYYYRLYY